MKEYINKLRTLLGEPTIPNCVGEGQASLTNVESDSEVKHVTESGTSTDSLYNVEEEKGSKLCFNGNIQASKELPDALLQGYIYSVNGQYDESNKILMTTMGARGGMKPWLLGYNYYKLNDVYMGVLAYKSAYSMLKNDECKKDLVVCLLATGNLGGVEKALDLLEEDEWWGGKDVIKETGIELMGMIDDHYGKEQDDCMGE